MLGLILFILLLSLLALVQSIRAEKRARNNRLANLRKKILANEQKKQQSGNKNQ